MYLSYTTMLRESLIRSCNNYGVKIYVSNLTNYHWKRKVTSILAEAVT